MNFRLLGLVIGAIVLSGFTTYLFTHKRQLSSNVTLVTLKEFQNYMAKYNKHYSSNEETTMRLTIYENNVEKINRINSDPTKTYKAGINQFTDQTHEELVSKILMRDLPPHQTNIHHKYYADLKVPNAIDWTTKGAVTPVKNQGSCGSCWSFSTTGVLEGANFLKSGKLESFSEEQLVDCCGSKGYQCEGCSGAWPEWALNYVKVQGIASEVSYPYTAGGGMAGNCEDSEKKSDFTPSAYTMVKQDDESELQKALTTQPVSVCVDASTWFSYSSGVFNDCGSTFSLDHAVLLVGYQDKQKYYRIKNSWDTTWGEQGFIRLPVGANACGVANHAITVGA